VSRPASWAWCCPLVAARGVGRCGMCPRNIRWGVGFEIN
jgi:hypothetical protein